MNAKKSRNYAIKRLKLADKYIDLVLSNKKISTIRYGHIQVENKVILLESRFRKVMVKVIKVDYTKNFGDLNEEDALNDGFNDLTHLKSELKIFYPFIKNDALVTIIKFVKK